MVVASLSIVAAFGAVIGTVTTSGIVWFTGMVARAGTLTLIPPIVNARTVPRVISIVLWRAKIRDCAPAPTRHSDTHSIRSTVSNKTNCVRPTLEIPLRASSILSPRAVSAAARVVVSVSSRVCVVLCCRG